MGFTRPLIDYDVELVIKDSDNFEAWQNARVCHHMYQAKHAILEINKNLLEKSKFEQRETLLHEFTHIVMRNSQEYLEADKDNSEFRHMERDTDKMAIFINNLLGEINE